VATSSIEFYDWLIRVTTLIRAQKEPHEEDLFRIFVKELGQVLQFDHLAKYDAVSNRFSWYAGPEFEELNEELKASARNVDEETGEYKILSLWVCEHQETIVLGNLDNETRFQDTIRCLRRAGLQSVCAIPLSDAHRRLGSLVIASMRPGAYSEEDVRFGALAASQLALAIDDAINFRDAQDAAIFCLGTYTGSASDAELRKITVDYTVEFARVLHGSSPGASFSFLSGSGADQTGRSRMAFARYKGEAEEALLAAGFPRLYIFRPAYIYPVEPRKEPNFSYRSLRAIYPAFRVPFPNQVIPADHLARAMVDVAVREARESGKWILENRDIRTMVASPR
jgi:hypothetical protein